MSGAEAREAVRGYLAHTGGAEVSGPLGIYQGLRQRVPLGMIRSALKALGARVVEIGRWPLYGPDGDRIPRTSGGSRYGPGLPNFVRPFTLYRLAE